MKKTICIFSANYLPNIGGVEKYTQNLAIALEDLGYRVIIVTNNCFGLDDYEIVSDNITLYRLPCFPLINGRLPLPKKNKQYIDLQNQLKQEHVDYVSINTRFYPHTFTGVKFAEEKNIRPILTDHGSAYLTFGNSFLDFFVRAWEHLSTFFLKKHSIDFYGVSKASEKWLKQFGIEACGSLNNAIDVDAFINSSSDRSFKKELGINEGAFLVTFVGRLIPEKGIIPFLEAAKLLQENENVHFLIAGDGPLKKTVLEKSTPNVHFLGRLNSKDISSLLIESNAFCSPTRSEGFSTSMLEAGACKAVPIITNVGGVEEVLSSSGFGIILKSADPSEIASSIKYLFNNPKKCEDMSNRLQKYVKSTFSWRETALHVEEACKRAQK